MRVRNIARSNSEARTRRILCGGLEKRGYRINPAVRVSDVLEADWRELDQDGLRCLRTMHFDFVITQGDHLTPRFVVEFDGPQHTPDSTAARLDAVKNQFCMEAGLPILRVSSRELDRNEGVSLLAWMLERWAAWQKEGAVLRREVDEEWKRLLQSGARLDDLVDSGRAPASAEFYFDIRHPYPAVLTVAARLHQVGVVTLRADSNVVSRLTATRAPGQLAECVALPAGEGPAGADSRYLDYQAQVRQWQPGQTSAGLGDGPVIYTASERVVWRWALPTGWDAPAIIASEPDGDRPERRMEWWVKAMGYLWNSDLPGAPSHQVAEGLAEYLVLRNVEQWAHQHWPAGDR
jgi:very-short-patch-repair endonuclease